MIVSTLKQAPLPSTFIYRVSRVCRTATPKPPLTDNEHARVVTISSPSVGDEDEI